MRRPFRSARARPRESVRASSALRETIARPNTSRNEWIAIESRARRTPFPRRSPGCALAAHVEATSLGASEVALGLVLASQLLDVEGDGGLANARAARLLHALTRVRRCPGVAARADADAAAPGPGEAARRGAPAAADGGGGAWAAPGLAARGLESVRKALHDQLYVVFRIYCALGTVAQQSAKKLCLETFFLFVNDISLYAALGYRDFAATGAGVARPDGGARARARARASARRARAGAPRARRAPPTRPTAGPDGAAAAARARAGRSAAAPRAGGPRARRRGSSRRSSGGRRRTR